MLLSLKPSQEMLTLLFGIKPFNLKTMPAKFHPILLVLGNQSKIVYRLEKEIQTLKTPLIAVILSSIYVLTSIFSPVMLLCSLVARSLLFSSFRHFGQFLGTVIRL